MKLFDEILKEKEEPEEPKQETITGQFKIAKANDEKHLAFGWANIALDEDGEEQVDWQDDMIDPEDLEKAAYLYVIKYRSGGEMHKKELKNRAVLVESIVFTEEKLKALNLPEGSLPTGWWIGFYVPDDDLWQKVKDGTYPMFSIEGKATRVAVDDDGNEISADNSQEQ